MVENAQEKKDYHMHWRQFIAACLMVFGGQGLVYNCIANYITPIMYVTGQGQAVVGAAISIASLCMLILLAFVGKILKRFKLKPLLIICSVVGLGSFIAMGTLHNIGGFYVAFALMQMAGAIPVYVAGPMLVTNWFEAKKGMLTGIMMVCGNAGAVIGSIAAGILLGGEPYNTMAAFGVMGAVSLIFMIVGSSMAIMHPAMVGLKPYGADENGSQASSEEGQEAVIAGITSAKALKSTAFFSLFIVVFFIICCASFSTLMSNFANVNYGYTNAQGSIIMATFSGGAIVGGLLWGTLDDKLGVVKTTVVAFCCIIIGILGLAMLSGGGFAIMLAFGFIFGMGCASSGVQQPMLVAKLFGQRDYGAIFSKIQMAQSAAGLVAVLAIGIVAQATGSYIPAMIALAIFMIIAIFLVFIAAKSAKKLWEADGQTMPRV